MKPESPRLSGSMELRFECVVHYVSDLEEAIRFYRDVLGLRLASRGTLARFEIGEILLELVPDRTLATEGSGGNARLCLGVEDLADALGALSLKGARAGRIRSVDGGSWCSIADPDGNEMILWQSKQTG